MKLMRTTTPGQHRQLPMAGLSELLLCVMFAAAELLESLRPREKTT